ncbi:LOW QUALITY PROTEIN: guanine nucleotide exchange protein smcr8b [Hypomesus transpacificus]|uniref:LOW QUALITY PROTEIN: guanine nucleotide exchange protein smcr8b n=1 Tax=Hypomesus transpacificus TaxID=137520 RepID=UPI001F0724FA|nr:LOW QUALITY PROTEIN: guanine nucleotide exchange protein smcr8b [Hypomesus transpacificus]
MIGSPDLLAFTGAEGFGEARERAGELQGVPEELSVPLLPRAHPWAATSSALFLRDFILVAEFSEQVGPQPVLTIPDDPRILGAFDLNHFSLRIMSVDYQACSPGPSPSPSGPSHTGPAPRLSFCEDSRVVMGDWGSFAYVQHLTLYDLEARGFVRPFCMAYVSAEHRKLMEHFLLLSEGLGQASDWLKTGNRRAFARELTRKLLDLEYTRSVLQKESEAQSANELAGIERSILEHRDLLRQVTSFPNRKLKQPDFLPYDTYDPEPHPLTPEPPSPSYTPRLVKLPPSRRFDRRMKPLEELSDAYFLSLTLEQLATVERRLRGDLPSLFTARITQALTRKYPLNNFLFEPWNPEEGEELQGREGGSSGEGLPVPECDGQCPPASLESFFSCVEELSIKLEIGSRGAGQGVEEEAAGDTMVGSVSSGDSIEVLGTEKSYRSQPVTTDTGELRELLGGEGRQVEAGPGHVEAGPVRVEAGPGRVEAGPGHVEAGPGRVEAGRVRVPARRSNSEDSIEVLSTTLVPDDLAAITEETEESPGNAAMEEHCTLAQKDSHQQPEGCRANGQVKGQRLVPKLRLNLTPAVTPEALPLTSVERWSLSCSADEAVDCSSSPCSSEAPSLSSRHHGNSHQRRRRAGLRALRFLHQNSFSQHVVFCLLSGRPLLVIGGEERSVQRTVGALALYLPNPGRPGSSVQPCLSRPLSLADLLTYRLIGIVRSSGTPFPSMHPSVDHYGRYVALLDLDHRTLRCPPYSGSLIGRLADPRSLIGRGSTYLLHLESCLTALANRAFVYTFSPALQRPSMLGEEEVVQAERRRHFLCGRGCSSQDDLKVMDFLSDLIKQRQTGSGPPVLRFSYSPTLLHKNTAG